MQRAVFAGITVAVLLSVGCSAPKQSAVSSVVRLPAGPISVVEFATQGAFVHYDQPYEAFGLVLASEIAAELRRLGHPAEVVPAAGTPRGTVVRGRITVIDGGSRGQRFWVGMGAGAAQFGAEGEVLGAEGTHLASFRDSRRSSGMGNAWGGSAYDLVNKCLRVVGQDIARMVSTGEYHM